MFAPRTSSRAAAHASDFQAKPVASLGLSLRARLPGIAAVTAIALALLFADSLVGDSDRAPAEVSGATATSIPDKAAAAAPASLDSTGGAADGLSHGGRGRWFSPEQLYILAEALVVLCGTWLPSAWRACRRRGTKAKRKTKAAAGGSPVAAPEPCWAVGEEEEIPDILSPPEQPPSQRVSRLVRFNQAINSHAKAGNVRRAEKLFEDIRKAGVEPDSISYNSVLHAHAKHGDEKRAAAWMRRMKAEGHAPNTTSYNIMMDACVKADNVEGAERWLRVMLAEGVQANEVSYATIIHARAKQGATLEAERWLLRMFEDGIHPNVVSFNSLVYACSRCGDAAGAERWLLRMQAHGLQPCVATYTAVIDACAKSADVARAEKWMHRMLARGLVPNVVTFSSMIDACAKAEDLERAEAWLCEMVRQGVAPNVHTFAALVNACARQGDVEGACRALTRMEDAGVEGDVVVYSAVLDACARVGDCDRGREVFERMRARSIRPNIITFSALARPLAHRGQWEEVERIEAELVNEGLQVNEYFLYALLLSYASAKPRQADRAEAAFLRAHAQGVNVNRHVVAALARAVGRARFQILLETVGCRPHRTSRGAPIQTLAFQ